MSDEFCVYDMLRAQFAAGTLFTIEFSPEGRIQWPS